MTKHTRIPHSLRSSIALALALTASAGCEDDEGTAIVPVDGGADAAGGARADGGEAGVPEAGSASDGGADTSTAMTVVDTDIAVVRLNPNGTLDTTFGTNGIAIVDLGTAASATVRDQVYGLARDAQNRLVLFGARKGQDRTDLDRAIVRLTANGAVDTTFAKDGAHTLNVGNLPDNPRHGFVQDDGKIVMAGYTPQPTGVGAQSANKIVLVRLLETGMPDPAFGFMGIVNSAPFVPADPAKTEWGMAEAYSVAYQSGKYVTAGYGRVAPSGTVDVVSARYTETGALDPTWGTNGVVTLDLVGQDDRGRNLVVLPGDKVLIVGSAKPSATDLNALALMLQPNGALDATFDGDGHKLFDFGRTDEAFFGAAVSPSKKWAAAAGHSGGMAGGVMEDDDATLLLLPLATGVGAEFAKAVPISQTANDRFLGVTFDASDKAYAAGWVNEGGDTRMVVARYEPTGALDPSFGNGGVFTVNVSAGPGTVEAARAVVLESDGKIVIAGEIEKR